MLGQREPGVYGTMTLEQINAQVMERAAAAGAQVVCFQSNHEGALIDMLQAEAAAAAGVIINPGALTHYGLSLRDALAALRIPIVEVHISNVYRREPFRHTSVVAPVATGQIAGLGWYGYVLALEWLLQQTKKE